MNIHHVAASRATWLVAAGWFLLLVPDPLFAQECLECHGDVVDAAKFDASVHAPVECSGCHSDLGEYPHPETIAKVDCVSCHPDATQQYDASVHAKARAKGDVRSADCVACHGRHDIIPKSDPASRTNRFNVPATCASCHEDAAITKQHPVPPPEAIEKYFQSAHGRGTLEKGLNVSAICSDCHGGHRILPKEDAASTISHANVPKTCGQCHEKIVGEFEQSAHGKLWAKRDARGPVCTSCHESHGITPTDLPSFRQGIATGCSNCHAEEAPTYRDSFHGQATALGYVAAAKCSDCHTPHLNLPASNPRSSIAPANLVKTCSKCHPDANTNFVKFQPHADPHREEKSPPLHNLYQFMSVLLIGTFGFFGLHTLLWLQRSLVAFFRREFPRHEDEPTWVMRFEKKHRLTHIAIVVSFLMLAASGLPLMYSHSGWGKALAALFGGVGVTTVIHRAFAIVTFGYALYHLGFILRGAFVRRDWRMFVGPDSMVPRVRDLVDLKNMVKWFFYRGPWPRFDRWTYWEKFDYFAVFWGVPIIGLSGLMLWIPETVSRVFPGWFLNAAMLVHSDEALLAIGFIFTFHFFHNHIRPQVFPMDPVIFVGKMPLETFRSERPDQYARAVDEGRLDALLTGPPTRGQILFARWFGFAALSIGVVLIIAIYSSFVTRFFSH